MEAREEFDHDVAKAIKYHDVTRNGVPFDWWLASAAGAGFCLLVTNETPDQINAAKADIRRDRDVVGRIRIRQRP